MTDGNWRARKGDYVRVTIEGHVMEDLPKDGDSFSLKTTEHHRNVYLEFPEPGCIEMEQITGKVLPGRLYEDAEGDICFAREEHGKMHLYYTKELDTVLLEDLGENCLPLRQIYPALDF